MRFWMLAIFVITTPLLQAQDSSRVAPKWVMETLVGGGTSEAIHVRTGPDEWRSMDMGGWFHLRFAGEHALDEHWSVRLAVGFAANVWESGGYGDPYATPSPQGDRWDVGVGAGYQLYRGRRSQFSLAGELSAIFGMDVYRDYRTDTAWQASSFQSARLYYEPTIVPELSGIWRLRIGKDSFGATARVGVQYYSFTHSGTDLSSGLPVLPPDLMPLTGTHTGFAYVWSIGFFAWQ